MPTSKPLSPEPSTEPPKPANGTSSGPSSPDLKVAARGDKPVDVGEVLTEAVGGESRTVALHPLNPESLAFFHALCTPAHPRVDGDAELETQAAEIKAMVDELLDLYRLAERRIRLTSVDSGIPPADLAGSAEKLRIYAKGEIERIYSQVHAEAATAKRVGLMLRIERMAQGTPVAAGDRGLMGFYDARITDEEIAPIAEVWLKEDGGAKPTGAPPGKWEQLRRLLDKHGDKTTVEALKGEWKAFRKMRDAQQPA
jgi:hypothetical protein